MAYVGFSSKTMGVPALTDYLSRVVQPQFASIEGVLGRGGLSAARRWRCACWLDANRMAARGHLGRRAGRRAAPEQRAGGARAGQGPVRGVEHPRQHRPGERGRVPRHGDQARRRCAGAPGRRGHGRAGRGERRRQRDDGRRQGHLPRPAGGAQRQPAGDREAHPRTAARHQAEPARGRGGAAAVRARALHRGLDRRGAPDAARSRGDRGAGDLPVPGLGARSADPGGDHSAVDAGCRGADAGVRLLDQPAHAAGDGAGDRAGGGRRDRGGGERAPPHRGRQVARAGRADRRARGGRPGDRDDAHRWPRSTRRSA